MACVSVPAFHPPWPVGISDHAQKELGDIVYVDLPEAGDSMAVGKTIAAVESVKAAADGVHARHQCMPSNMASLPGASKQKRDAYACRVSLLGEHKGPGGPRGRCRV